MHADKVQNALKVYPASFETLLRNKDQGAKITPCSSSSTLSGVTEGPILAGKFPLWCDEVIYNY